MVLPSSATRLVGFRQIGVRHAATEQPLLDVGRRQSQERRAFVREQHVERRPRAAARRQSIAPRRVGLHVHATLALPW